jgi:hypothetical protein
MKILVLTIPGLDGNPQVVPTPPSDPANPTTFGQYKDLGSLLSNGLNVAFTIAGFLMLIWLAWGVMHYIFAGGNKQSLDHAKKRITWSIAGFIIIVLAFMISQYTQTIFNPNGVYKNFNKTTPLSTPIIGPLPNTY